MAIIKQVLLEQMPDVKLIGRRYTAKDFGENGTFSAKWGEWFQNDYFEQLKVCSGLESISDDFIGAMRVGEQGFEYWIGIFMSPDDQAPAGFAEVTIPAGKIGVCYVYGRDNTPELYGMDVHKACIREWAAKGWHTNETAWCFERYHCPRFTVPDEKGNVILDYCAYLTEVE